MNTKCCVVVALSVSVLAGCSSGGGTGASPAAGSSSDTQALSALRKAVKATEKAGSARLEGTATTGTTTSTGKGALDWSQDAVTGTLVVSGSGAAQTRCLRTAVYLRVNDAVAASLGGKHWLKYDRSALASAIQQLTANEPAKPLRELVASGDVREVGPQTVHGVRTTHYLGTTDTERIELWIDKDGLVIKAVRQDDGSAGTTTTTWYYTGYGAKVAVKAPPSADTVDYTALLNRQSVSPSGTP
ncbi:hypothetical protein OG607_17930 [Streptomyces sp. NBC_01537]|uniref:hypothetical protein n=1 Tax=Streptomyces sp. NBC_01537 TaxID=2903896 RepID=UPI0038665F1F